jgi:hypothetical protein
VKETASHAKAQRRKENLLETRQRFALCAFAWEIFFLLVLWCKAAPL